MYSTTTTETSHWSYFELTKDLRDVLYWIFGEKWLRYIEGVLYHTCFLGYSFTRRTYRSSYIRQSPGGWLDQYVGPFTSGGQLTSGKPETCDGYRVQTSYRQQQTSQSQMRCQQTAQLQAQMVQMGKTLWWRHNERDGVSNHRRYSTDCSGVDQRKKTGLCEGNSPVTGEFPHKGPVTRKCIHFMTSSWKSNETGLSLWKNMSHMWRLFHWRLRPVLMFPEIIDRKQTLGPFY